MTLSWKALIFLSAASILSISPLPVRGASPGPPGTVRVIVRTDEAPGVPGGPGVFALDEDEEFPGDPVTILLGEDDDGAGAPSLFDLGEDEDPPGCPPGCIGLFAMGDPERGRRVEKRVVVTSNDDERPRLGLVLRMEVSPRTDAKGAVVEAVTPGSPADDAGVKVGDIIVKYGGQPLGGAKPSDDKDISGPSSRLVEMARKLTDGEKVSLEILRGGRTLNLDLVARKLKGANVFQWNGNIPDFDIEKYIHGNVPGFSFQFGGEDWLDMEMVALNPELGEYFGTSEGVLVVKAPEASLGIKAGDVIQKVGDRKASSPSSVFRVLNSYEPGETVTLEVIRKQKHQTLQIQVPQEDREDSQPEAPAKFHRPPGPPAPPPPPRVSRGVQRG
jgi:hypothetical protein